jgi:hypothetical protein
MNGVLDVMVYCPKCWCGVKEPGGYDTDGGYVIGVRSSQILSDGWGVPWFDPKRPGPENCDGTCPCHTGIGMLPRLAVVIGTEAIDKVMADEQAAMDARRNGE